MREYVNAAGGRGAPASAPPQRASVPLDVIRAAASLAVMVGHLRALFFISLSHLRDPSPLVKLVFAATSLGHQAVIVFFVLSGYLVGGSVARTMASRRWSWRDYLSRRAARLYAVLLPALLLTWLWDEVGIRYFWRSGVYHRASEYAYILPFSVAEHDGLTTLLGNGVFLQTITVPPFGSNSALWSLANEWWYYVLFPLCVAAYTTSSVKRVAYAAAAAVVLWLVGAWIAGYFAVWLLGAALAVATRSRTSVPVRRGAVLAGLGLFIISLAIAGLHLLGQVAEDGLVAVAFTALLYPIVASEAAPPHSTRAAALWAGLAGFSYTLYLVHLPLLVFLQAVTRQIYGERWQPTLAHATGAVAIACVTVAYAWAVSRWTEAKTDVFRARVVDPLIRKLFALSRSTTYRTSG